MSDALEAYRFVVDNVPSWIDILQSLQSKIKEREDHVSRVPVPARSLKKSGSCESIRPNSQEKDVKLEILSAPQDGHLADPIDREHLLPDSRIRKSASVVSADSIPHKFRTRSMIIVYYDSEIQKTFEQVVRHIGTARNQLRRARTTMQMNALINGRDLPSATPTSNFSPSSFRSSRTMPQNGYYSAASGAKRTDSLSLIDATLEKAQSFCERGAHQFLREGNSEAEISGAQGSFEEAKRIAGQEVENSKQQADEDMSMSRTEDARKERLGPHLRGFLQNGGIEMDSDHNDGEEVDDPMMKLARHQTRRGGVPLSMPA